MTLIVSPTLFKSKADLKANLDKGCMVHEPSIMGEWTKLSTDLPIGFRDVVTNHPLRSKFATIERKPDGWKVK